MIEYKVNVHRILVWKPLKNFNFKAREANGTIKLNCVRLFEDQRKIKSAQNVPSGGFDTNYTILVPRRSSDELARNEKNKPVLYTEYSMPLLVRLPLPQ
jgi:hypothetical protein